MIAQGDIEAGGYRRAKQLHEVPAQMRWGMRIVSALAVLMMLAAIVLSLTH